MSQMTGSGRRPAGTGMRGVPLAWLAALLLFAAGCAEKGAPGGGQPERPRVAGVTISALVPVAVEDLVDLSGSVKAARTTVVASRVIGTVLSLAVREGDAVEEGQFLLAIDDRDAAERERGAEAGLREAQKGLEAAVRSRELADATTGRYARMFEEKAISRQEMDQFDTRSRLAGLEVERMREAVNRAGAGLAEAKLQRGFARVTSPLKGLVVEKRTEVGSMAVPGMPLLILESTADYRLEIAVDEGFSGRVRVGMPLAVSVSAIGLLTTGKVVELLPVDPRSHTFTAKVSIRGPGLKSGLWATAGISRGKRETLLVPKSALVERGQLTGVYAVDGGGIVSLRLVRTGREHDGRVELLSGVKAGERIVVKGAERAVDGGIVEGA